MQAMNSVVYNGQSLLDKAIESTGDVENVFDMAIINNISITQDLQVGTELKIAPITSKATVSFFNEFNRPATAISNTEQQQIDSQGIDYMIIDQNFIVA
jgi:hypothetical protein